mgnify:CR=1 FL=1
MPAARVADLDRLAGLRLRERGAHYEDGEDRGPAEEEDRRLVGRERAAGRLELQLELAEQDPVADREHQAVLLARIVAAQLAQHVAAERIGEERIARAQRFLDRWLSRTAELQDDATLDTRAFVLYVLSETGLGTRRGGADRPEHAARRLVGWNHSLRCWGTCVDSPAAPAANAMSARSFTITGTLTAATTASRPNCVMTG